MFEGGTTIQNRCCSPVHDATIKESYAELWPGECQGDYYEGSKHFLCLGCHPEQPKFVDTEQKIIRVCESLLRTYYGNEDLNKPTDKYEECGAWNDPDPVLTLINEADPSEGYEMDSEDPILIFPKTAYANAEEFFDDFEPAEIPFFDGFSI